jgi:hypothetical protein
MRPHAAAALSRRLFAALLAIAGAIATAAAQPGGDGVLGETAVPDRSDAARAAALPSALANALSRLGPDPQAAAAIDTAAALAADPLLLQRFEYAQVTRPTASGIPSIKLMLRAWFAAAPARALLVNAGVPVWRGGRVAPMLWLVEDSDDGRRLLDGSDGVAQPLGAALLARGIAPSWSVNDLEDLRMAERLDLDSAPQLLDEAARRTGSDPAVLAFIRHADEGTAVEWFVHGGDAPGRFSSVGGDAGEALLDGVDRLVALLAERAAVRPADVSGLAQSLDRGPGEYVLWLENLGRAGAYGSAIGLLQGQTMVESVVPEQASEDRVRLRARISAPLAQLLSMLAADGRLSLSPTPPGDADLTLRWQD